MLDFGNVLKRQTSIAAEPPTCFLALAEVERILDELDFHTVVIE
jgi:hypothetical protein